MSVTSTGSTTSVPATPTAPPVTSPSATTSSSASGVTQSLGQQAFLQLLMTELQNQDPTQPMDDTQFVTQLATFNSLSQLNNISASTTDMDTQLKNLNQLIGQLTGAPAATPSASGTPGGSN